MATIEVQVDQIGPATSRGAARTHTVLVDRPVDKGGEDRGPLGGELLLLSLGGCFMSNLLAAGRARGVSLSGARVVVVGTLGAAPPQFDAFTMKVQATCDDPALLPKLATIAENACIVTNTLRKAAPVSLEIQPAAGP
jgi:putative redox protein